MIGNHFRYLGGLIVIRKILLIGFLHSLSITCFGYGVLESVHRNGDQFVADLGKTLPLSAAAKRFKNGTYRVKLSLQLREQFDTLPRISLHVHREGLEVELINIELNLVERQEGTFAAEFSIHEELIEYAGLMLIYQSDNEQQGSTKGYSLHLREIIEVRKVRIEVKDRSITDHGLTDAGYVAWKKPDGKVITRKFYKAQQAAGGDSRAETTHPGTPQQ